MLLKFKVKNSVIAYESKNATLCARYVRSRDGNTVKSIEIRKNLNNTENMCKKYGGVNWRTLTKGMNIAHVTYLLVDIAYKS